MWCVNLSFFFFIMLFAFFIFLPIYLSLLAFEKELSFLSSCCWLLVDVHWWCHIGAAATNEQRTSRITHTQQPTEQIMRRPCWLLSALRVRLEEKKREEKEQNNRNLPPTHIHTLTYLHTYTHTWKPLFKKGKKNNYQGWIANDEVGFFSLLAELWIKHQHFPPEREGRKKRKAKYNINQEEGDY